MILNLTRHATTHEQVAAGVIDQPPAEREWLTQTLTFDSIPSQEALRVRAEAIAAFAVEQGILCGAFDTELGFGQVTIGGAPFFMIRGIRWAVGPKPADQGPLTKVRSG